jgi:hypothetical protein
LNSENPDKKCKEEIIGIQETNGQEMAYISVDDQQVNLFH